MYQYIFTGSNWKTCITFSLPFMALGKGKMIKNILVTPNTVCADKKPYKYGASWVEYYQNAVKTVEQHRRITIFIFKLH